MKKISREDLFREIGEIDESYVEEAERVQRRRRTAPWVRAMAVAASLLVCVGIGYGTLRLTGSSNDTAGMAGGGEMEYMEMQSAAQDCGETMNAQATQETGEDAAPQEAAFALEGIPEEEISEEETARDVAEQVSGDPENGIEDLATGRAYQEADGATANEQKESSKDDLEDAQAVALTESCGLFDVEKLTWQQAQEDAAYGKYVSVQTPDGYVYESGVRSGASLRVVWLDGMAEIAISCRHADESVSDWLVDTGEPEEYDLSLYAIPWADSVPQKLWEKVFNATFRPDQITPEIVAARSYQVQDPGDVDGWRTELNILYEDNVLVEIRSKGPDPEEIYGLINLEN